MTQELKPHHLHPCVGSPLNYTITTTPGLISGPPPVTTSTSTTINYNTDFTFTVTASNRCAGNGIPSDVLNVNIGEFKGCPHPSSLIIHERC